MKTWSVFNRATGEFVSVFSGPEGSLTQNLPEGCGAIEGRYNAHAHRLDVDTGAVIAWVPPRPAEDALRTWSWCDESKRWEAQPTLAALKRRSAEAIKTEITAVEAMQPRSLREAALDGGEARNAAISRLNAIDSQILELRNVLKAIEAAPDAQALAALCREDRMAG